MRTIIYISVFLICLTELSKATGKDSLNGTWCVGQDGLVLTFSGKDSLFVTSKSDTSVKGEGTYLKTDTTFTATVINGDMKMEMKYSYKWFNNDSVGAKAELFTINGESVNYPTEWMSMTRCNNKITAKQDVTSNSNSKTDKSSKNKKTNKK